MKNTNTIQEMEKYISSICKDNYVRLGRTFKTKNHNYFLDTGTGKIFKISDSAFNILNSLFLTNNFKDIYDLGLSSDEKFEGLKEIEEAIRNENILQAAPVNSMFGPHKHSLENMLEKDVRQITLELTEKCNLRCKYCIYGNSVDAFRNFGNSDMSYETAKKAVDFGCKHSEKEIYIGFYGGEPLIKFDLIKKIINYAENEYPDKEIGYSMTTNATLIDEEIAKYLYDHDFTLTLSIDGPKEIHDENRVFVDGTGSFEATMKGYHNLIEIFL